MRVSQVGRVTPSPQHEPSISSEKIPQIFLLYPGPLLLRLAMNTSQNLPKQSGNNSLVEHFKRLVRKMESIKPYSRPTWLPPMSPLPSLPARKLSRVTLQGLEIIRYLRQALNNHTAKEDPNGYRVFSSMLREAGMICTRDQPTTQATNAPAPSLAYFSNPAACVPKQRRWPSGRR